MAAQFTDSQLEMLIHRWKLDPSPHLSLQLADLHRQRGDLDQAIPALEKGLEAHPRHLSLQVALGRYRLEAEDPEGSADVLRDVVDQDPGHLVANKLLVRSYLATGSPHKAGDRLDLYALLNDSDPELEELRSAVREAELRQDLMEPAVSEAVLPESEIPEPGIVEEFQADVVERSDSEKAVGPSLVVPDLSSLAPPSRRRLSGRVGENPFAGLGRTALSSQPDGSSDTVSVFGLPAISLMEAPSAAVSEPAVTEPSPVEAEAPQEALKVEEVTDSAPSAEFVEAESASVSEVVPEGPPAVEEQAAEESSVPAGDSHGATATLGALYLSQGHLTEAEETFRQVLSRDPMDMESRDGLAQVEVLRDEQAAKLAKEEGPDVSTKSDRQIDVLKSYLKRIRPDAFERSSEV